MLAIGFFKWWYGPGWVRFARSWAHDTGRIWSGFSGSLLLRTLFSPWRRIISAGGGSVDERMRALIDNTVSRFIGGAVRTIVVAVALGLIVFRSLAAAVQLIAWPLLPPLVPYLLVAGLIR